MRTHILFDEKPIFQRMFFLLQDVIGESMDDRLQL